MLFSQKLQQIGNKLDMFLIGNIPGNLITALESGISLTQVVID